jgi:hypothetical protein
MLQPLPLSFVLAHTELSWREVARAIDRGWLSMAAAPELARTRRLEEDPVRSPIWELADLRPDEPSRELLGKLAAREPPMDEKVVDRRWLTLHLLYLAEHAPSDPLPAIEEIWCDFEHPVELNRFIGYMPAQNPKLVRKRTVRENLQAMRDQWYAWAKESRAAWENRLREDAA